MARLNSEPLTDRNVPAYEEGGRKSAPLPFNRIVHSLLLALSYRWNVAGGTGAGALFNDAAFRVIDEVTWRGNGQDLLVLDGTALYLWNLLMFREMLAQTPPTALVAGTAQASRASWIMLPAVFGHAGAGASNGDDQFGYPPLSEPSLSIKWAPARNLVTAAGDGTYSIDQATVRLFQRFYDKPVTPMGGFAPVFARQYRRDVTGAGNVQVDLEEIRSDGDNIVGHELRAVMIQGQSGGVSGYQYAPDNTVVEEMRLDVPGEGTVRELIAFDAVQQENKANYGLGSLQTGTAVFDAAGHDQNVGLGQLWNVSGRGNPVLRARVKPGASGDSRVLVTAFYTGGRYAAMRALQGRGGRAA